MLWLLCQTLSLAALAPTECCAAHHVASASDVDDCHQQARAADATVCPMHGSDGGECPMHAGAAGAPDAASQNAPCAMRGLCNVPASALAMLIPMQGVLAERAAPAAAHAQNGVAPVVPPRLTLDLPLVNDPPPPRT